jgi:hypothetical protein
LQLLKYYGARHTAKNRFDHVEKLSSRRKRRCLDGRALAADYKIVFIDALEEFLRYMPQCCVPGEIEFLAVTVLSDEHLHHANHLVSVLFGAVKMSDLIGGQFNGGHHLGKFLGVAPTGRKIQFETVDVMRVRDGKIAEHWGVANLFSLMQQLGAWPAK